MLNRQFNITFIPIWLENAMARTGMNFTDALTKEKLLGIVSQSDVVFYLLANYYFLKNFLPDNILNDNSFFINNDNDSLRTESINTEYWVQKQIDYDKGTSVNDLFLQYAFGETVDINVVKDKPFAVHAELIDDCNIVVTLRFTDRVVEPYRFMGNFYEQLLKTLNFYYPFNELAKTELFKKYTKYIAMTIKQ